MFRNIQQVLDVTFLNIERAIAIQSDKNVFLTFGIVKKLLNFLGLTYRDYSKILNAKRYVTKIVNSMYKGAAKRYIDYADPEEAKKDFGV